MFENWVKCEPLGRTNWYCWIYKAELNFHRTIFVVNVVTSIHKKKSWKCISLFEFLLCSFKGFLHSRGCWFLIENSCTSSGTPRHCISFDRQEDFRGMIRMKYTHVSLLFPGIISLFPTMVVARYSRVFPQRNEVL